MRFLIKEIDLKTANYVLLLEFPDFWGWFFGFMSILIGEHFVSLIVADLLHCILLIDLMIYCYFKSSKGGAIIVNWQKNTKF